MTWKELKIKAEANGYIFVSHGKSMINMKIRRLEAVS